jgi:hypothetical protein
MTKKSFAVILIVAMTLMAVSAVAFAETSTLWSDSYSGVQFQYINMFGGSDWDTLRWRNNNNYDVDVTYSIKQSNGAITNYLITLKANQTTSNTDGDSSLGSGSRVHTISVKAK